MTAVTTFHCDEPGCSKTTQRIERGWQTSAKSRRRSGRLQHFCPEHVLSTVLSYLCPRCSHPDHLREYCATVNREKDCPCHYPYSA
jgi:hypothetical protein